MAIRAAYASHKEIRFEIIMGATYEMQSRAQPTSGFANHWLHRPKLGLNSRKESYHA